MTVEPLRVAFRRQVRDQALQVAYDLVSERGWDQVRVGEIAEATGVSRPTLYKEFGSKQGLGEALVLRETERFLEGIATELAAHADDARAGIEAAVAFTFEEADRSPLLHAVLTSTRAGDDSLLPFLTTRSAPLLEAATSALTAWFAEHSPDISHRDVEEGVDALVRLVVSHLVLPATNRSGTPERLARLAMRFLTA